MRIGHYTIQVQIFLGQKGGFVADDGNQNKPSGIKPSKNPTVHHLVPRSRCGELFLHKDDQRNKKNIRKKSHQAWHTLFENMTPEEVILFVIDNFFPEPSLYENNIGDEDILRLYKKRRGGNKDEKPKTD